MFNEANAVENFIRDLLAGVPKTMRDSREGFGRDSAALQATGLGWLYVPADKLPRQQTEVLVEAYVRDALIRLNPEIAALAELFNDALNRNKLYLKVLVTYVILISIPNARA